jgi:hypothetical protein
LENDVRLLREFPANGLVEDLHFLSGHNSSGTLQDKNVADISLL